MKYLKIHDNKGFYWDGKEHQEIDKITKDDLITLLNAAESDEFEIDPYDATLLKNRAHQIIYESIYEKFSQFLNDKTEFKTEVDRLYREAINKYSAKIENEEIDPPEEMNDSEIEEGGSDSTGISDIPF